MQNQDRDIITGSLKRFWSKMSSSIKVKFLITAALTLMFIGLAIYAVAYHNAYNYYYPSVEKNQLLQLETQAELFDNYLAERTNETHNFIKNIQWNLERMLEADELPHNWLEQFQLQAGLEFYYNEHQDIYEQVFLITPDLEMINSLYTADLRATQLQYDMASSLEKAEILTTSVSNFTNRPIVIIASPLKFYGETIAVLGFTVDLIKVNQLLTEKLQSKYHMLFGLDANNRYIFHPDSSVLLNPCITEGFVLEGDSGLLKKEVNPIPNQVYQEYIFYKKLNNTPDWYLLHRIPQYLVNQEVDTYLHRLLLVLVLAIVAGIILSYKVATSFSRPIEQMRLAFDKAAKGDLFTEIEQSKRSDELGQAVASFNSMIVQLRQKTYYDSLTGLPNRQLLSIKLSKILEETFQRQKSCALLLVSISSFKKINETYGFYVGDQVLKEVAERLLFRQEKNHKIAMVVRFSGDEFLLVLNDIDDLREVEKEAGRLLHNVMLKYHIVSNEIILQAVIGGVYCDYEQEVQESTLITTVSAARTQAKLAREKYVIITGEDQRVLDMQHRNKLESDLHKAVDRGQIDVYYQPVIDINTNQVRSVEALARWQHPEYGFISPTTFIPIAEECGIISTIGEYILDRASKQVKYWQQNGYPDLRLSFNVSPEQFTEKKFAETIIKIVEGNDYNPDKLIVEITEEVAMYNLDEQNERLRILRDWGISVSVDDFGTGYSSFRYLAQLSIQQVKIDKSFIYALMLSEKDKAIVNTIVSMSKALKMECVAEGVETREQLEYLQAIGCDKAQGYLLSKPLPALELSQWLEKNAN